MNNERVSIDKLIGEVFVQIYESCDNRELIFIKDNGDKYVFYHEQDCCETVYLDEIIGDLNDLTGSPLLIADEVIDRYNNNENDFDKLEPFQKEFLGGDAKYAESVTWTFYKFATQKGYVDVRWTGESNGYYSESVNIRLETK